MKLKSRRGSAVVSIGLLVGVAALAGPKARLDPVWIEADVPEDLDRWIGQSEGRVSALRPGDGRGITWHDSVARAPTPVSVVYLHGFSADRHEMEPVIEELGRLLSANVFYARLTGHGRDGAAMGEATAENWLADASEALSVGERLGERVVVVGTSTGGTLATWLGTRPEALGRVHALVLVSPNYHPRDRSSRVLLYPWGGQIARIMVGPERCFEPTNEEQARHWTTCYPVDVLSPMMALVERVRTSDVSSITVPTLVLYSSEDRVVDHEETLRVVSGMTGTDPLLHEVRSTTDPARHVLAGDILSPESNAEVIEAVAAFLRDALGVRVIELERP